MSKNIAVIEELANHELREDIFRLLEQHERYQDVVRYTYGQCENFARLLRELSWKTNRSPEFMSKFTKSEGDIINFLAGSVTRESVVDRYRQRHKSAVEFTKRLIRDITAFVEETERLRGEYESMMGRRLKEGLPDGSLESRFQDNS